MSKGSRPRTTNWRKYRAEHERIFGKRVLTPPARKRIEKNNDRKGTTGGMHDA